MQKKLLLLFLAVNCAMVQASEVNVDNAKDTINFGSHHQDLPTTLLNLSKEEQALNALKAEFRESGAFQKLEDAWKKKNKEDADTEKINECDCSQSSISLWLFGPTEKSKVGKEWKKIDAFYADKDKNDVKNIDTYKSHFNFILSGLDNAEKRLNSDNDVLLNWQKALTDCNADRDCFKSRTLVNYEDLSPEALKNMCYLVVREQQQKCRNQGIALSEEDLLDIYKGDQKIAPVLISMQQKIDSIEVLRNPKKE